MLEISIVSLYQTRHQSEKRSRLQIRDGRMAAYKVLPRTLSDISENVIAKESLREPSVSSLVDDDVTIATSGSCLSDDEETASSISCVGAPLSTWKRALTCLKCKFKAKPHW
jgi:hypothetical protein